MSKKHDAYIKLTKWADVLGYTIHGRLYDPSNDGLKGLITHAMLTGNNGLLANCVARRLQATLGVTSFFKLDI